MNGDVRRYIMRNRAVLTFVDDNQAGLAGATVVTQLRTRLQTQQTRIEELAEQQGTQGGGASSIVQSKNALLLELTGDLRDIARTARAMDIATPGTAAKFALPASFAAEAVMATARVFLANAQPMQADFVAYGLPADFFGDLQTDLDHYETAAGTQQSATQGRIGATEELEQEVGNSAKTVDALDAAVRNVFRGNKAKLAEWRHAKTIERGRLHHPPATPAAPSN